MTLTRKAIIFEARYAGHTLGFAAEFAQAFATAGYDTQLLLNGAVRDTPEIAETIAETDLYEIAFTEPFSTIFASSKQGETEWTYLEKIAKEHRPDRLIIPTGDALSKAFTPVSNKIRNAIMPLDIVLHQFPGAYPPLDKTSLKRWRSGVAALRALRRHRVMTCDAYVTMGPGKWITSAARGQRIYLPHVLQKSSPWNREEARRAFGLSERARVLVSIGEVAKRKGVDKLLGATQHSDWPEDLVLFLAGPVADDVRAQINAIAQEHPGRVHVIDRFLSNDEFAATFVAADIVWAMTPTNLGVSSTFLYAARHAKPAIVSHKHLSARWMCGKIGPGVPSRLEPDAIIRAIRRAQALPPQTPRQAAYLAEITDEPSYLETAVAPHE